MSGSSGGGPCGACKFLRRKCVAGCVFAPYFDAEEGTAHFAAVHKVFGASNAAKLLTRIPANRRLDAVVTLCYEALARLRDPVYGCVPHIFALQQQVVNLEAELAYVQARLSTVEGLPPAPSPSPPPPQLPCQLRNHYPAEAISSSDVSLAATSTSNNNNNNVSSLLQLHCMFQQQHHQEEEPSDELVDFNTLLGREDHEGGFHALAQEFVSKYFAGVKFRPPSPN